MTQITLSMPTMGWYESTIVQSMSDLLCATHRMAFALVEEAKLDSAYMVCNVVCYFIERFLINFFSRGQISINSTSMASPKIVTDLRG